jgi:hypothetical protein
VIGPSWNQDRIYFRGRHSLAASACLVSEMDIDFNQLDGQPVWERTNEQWLLHDGNLGKGRSGEMARSNEIDIHRIYTNLNP